jgi:nucleoside 2-deoxyribosyltransferase
MTNEYQIYFAGDLFDHKDLIGNTLITEYLEKASGGKYISQLPQDINPGGSSPEEIRNTNLLKLMECDVALFNFDGNELDSGSVVEFMFAKFVDIPSLIVRSDFRSSGDQGEAGDDWNLMCSFYPRTRILKINSMDWYQEAKANTQSAAELIDRLYTKVAKLLVEELDLTIAEPSLFKGDTQLAENIYQWGHLIPGGKMSAEFGGKEHSAKIISSKKGKGLI